MALYGHTGSVNCLALYGDRLVSGSKDRLVKGRQGGICTDFSCHHFLASICPRLCLLVT